MGASKASGSRPVFYLQDLVAAPGALTVQVSCFFLYVVVLFFVGDCDLMVQLSVPSSRSLGGGHLRCLVFCRIVRADVQVLVLSHRMRLNGTDCNTPRLLYTMLPQACRWAA